MQNLLPNYHFFLFVSFPQWKGMNRKTNLENIFRLILTLQIHHMKRIQCIISQHLFHAKITMFFKWWRETIYEDYWKRRCMSRKQTPDHKHTSWTSETPSHFQLAVSSTESQVQHPQKRKACRKKFNMQKTWKRYEKKVKNFLKIIKIIGIVIILPNSSSTNMPPFCVKHFLTRDSSIKNWNVNVNSNLTSNKQWTDHLWGSKWDKQQGYQEKSYQKKKKQRLLYGGFHGFENRPKLGEGNRITPYRQTGHWFQILNDNASNSSGDSN